MMIGDLVRKPTDADIGFVVDNLRPADRAEIAASTGALNPALVVSEAVRLSVPSITLLAPTGEPVGLAGVVPADAGNSLGIIWMVGTVGIETYRRPFLRHSRVLSEWLNSKYDVLANVVDARNTVHIRWLEWCGFTFINRHEQYGVEQRPFLEFVRIPNHV